MSASRASQELAQKTNVNPSVNRQTEATAEDFGEIGQIFDDHADRLDELQNELYHADFVGYYGSLSLLQATYPTAPANAFAIIVNASNIPQQIYRWENSAWTLIYGTDAFVSYNSKTQFPNPGVVDTLYFAKDTRLLYLWLNNIYIPINQSNPPSFYDTYQTTDPATLAVADFSAGANFYFIEEINTELMHFAVKQTQKDAAAFDGARVHIDGNNYDLETPTSQNGYDIYLLGSADNIGNPNGNNLPFNVWSFGGGEGTVQSWNDIEPDENGNIIATADDLPSGSSQLENSDGANQNEINEDFDTAITSLLSNEIRSVDDSLYLDENNKLYLNVNQREEEFIYSASRLFDLQTDSVQVISVYHNRSNRLIYLLDWKIITRSQIELADGLELTAGDRIRITYKYLINS